MINTFCRLALNIFANILLPSKSVARLGLKDHIT